MLTYILLMALAAASPAEADQKIFRFRIVEINGDAVTGRIFDVVVSETRIRKDRGRDSLILDAEAGKAFIVDHALEETFELDLPFRRDEILAGKAAEAYRLISSEFSAEIVGTSVAEDSTTIAGLECRDHSVRTRTPKEQGNDEITVCLTPARSSEAALYWQLMGVESELSPGTEQVWQHLREIGGFPLRWRFDLRKDQRRHTYTRLLETIEIVAPDEAAFVPNPDYKRSLPDPQGRFLSRPRPLPGS